MVKDDTCIWGIAMLKIFFEPVHLDFIDEAGQNALCVLKFQLGC
jgi:hypothetical protein